MARTSRAERHRRRESALALVSQGKGFSDVVTAQMSQWGCSRSSCGCRATNSKVEAVLAKAKDSQSQYLLSLYGAELGRSQIAGRRLEDSNNVPSNLTKGSGTGLSAVIYGNFADLLIGLYGTLEILVDPYTDFAKGTTGVRALQTIDIAVRHAESFAAMQDAIA